MKSDDCIQKVSVIWMFLVVFFLLRAILVKSELTSLDVRCRKEGWKFL